MDRTEISQDDEVIIEDVSAGITKRTTVGDLVGLPDIGWIAAGETWLFSSFNSTTKIGVITVPSNATLKYAVNNLVRFTQATGGTKFGKILAVTSTSITVWMPGLTLNNEAITAPMYSPLATPLGAQDGLGGSTPYKFHAYKSANTAQADVAFSTVVFNTELYDDNANYDASTGIYTVPVTGLYEIFLGTKIVGAGNGANMLWESYTKLVLNNTTDILVNNNNSYDDSYSNYMDNKMKIEEKLTAGDNLRVTWQGDTANSQQPSILGGREKTFFGARLISRL
jgi:hypothetical protein